MSDYTDIFRTEENQNWAKCCFAVEIARRGLLEICESEIRTFHLKILSKVKEGPACKNCSIQEIIPYSSPNHKCKHGKCNCPSKSCPLGICDTFRIQMENEHRYKELSWKNTNIEEWRNSPWEVAKCYFPKDGYITKLSAEQTDFHGIISLIINNNQLRKRFSPHTLNLACTVSKINYIICVKMSNKSFFAF